MRVGNVVHWYEALPLAGLGLDTPLPIILIAVLFKGVSRQLQTACNIFLGECINTTIIKGCGVFAVSLRFGPTRNER